MKGRVFGLFLFFLMLEINWKSQQMTENALAYFRSGLRDLNNLDVLERFINYPLSYPYLPLHRTFKKQIKYDEQTDRDIL